MVVVLSSVYSHRSVTVKRSMSCFISVSLEKLGAGKFLHSSKDVLDKVLPALVQLTTDPSPEARCVCVIDVLCIGTSFFLL